jgi:hypothetical protein
MPKRRWSNWARNRECESNVEVANTEGDLERLLQNAVRQGKHLRLAGPLSHSWSPIVENPDTIVRIGGRKRRDASDSSRRLKEIELLDETDTHAVVSVGAGATIRELDAFVRAKGYTLTAPTMLPDVTVGGVLATASHGTGFHVGHFSDQILEMRILKADGSIATVPSSHADFPAAQVALGTLGVLLSAKLEVERQFNVYVVRRAVPRQYVLEEFDDLIKSCDFLEILWFPLQDKMWLFMMDRSDSKADETPWYKSIPKRWSERLQQRAGETLIPWVARHTPALTPRLSRAASRLVYKESEGVQEASDAFHFIRTYPKAYDVSYAIPAVHTARAWLEAMDLVEQYGRADRYPVNLAFHCRFTKSSDAWLGPDYGHRTTCWIEAATVAKTPRWSEFLVDLEDLWFAIPGPDTTNPNDPPVGRPHWGKMYGREKDLKARYPKMADFLAVRQQWDPNRTFLNRFLEQDVFQI